MRSTDPLPDPESLLAHAGWLEELARRLVGPGAAADLVQDTYVVALEASPRGVRSMRSWLATVLWRLGRDRVRGEASRRERQRAAASGEASPSGAEIVERAEVQRLVLGAVLALEEPYRETVLLRYFERLSAAEIARRQGVPAATVRSRLARGLARLRELLDARHGGDRAAWLRALTVAFGPGGAPTAGLPAALTTAGAAAAAAGAIAMKTLILGASAALITLGLGWLMLRGDPREVEPAVPDMALAPAPAERLAAAGEPTHRAPSA